MTTTLPASKVPGILRNGSPVSLTSAVWIHATGVIRETDGKLYACMVVDTGGSFLPVLVKDPDPYELVLDDPTGFGHALLWLGAKYGVPTDKSLSFHAMHDPQPRWSYPIWGLYADGEPVFSMYDAAPGHAGFGPRALLIPGCKGLPRLEALRLAVLAVAGVQV